MINFIEKLPQPKFPATFTADALRRAQKMLKESNRHSDDTIGKAIIFITDGKPTDRSEAELTVRQSK